MSSEFTEPSAGELEECPVMVRRYIIGLESEKAALKQDNAALREALINGGRECAEIEFGKDHEHIDRLASATWNNWIKSVLEVDDGRM